MNGQTILARRKLAETRLRLDDDIGDIVRVFGDIGGDAAVKGADVALAIAAADQRKTLAILIDSPGGIVVDAQRICDAIAARKGRTRTVAVTGAHSAAAIIFAAGQQRVCYKHTTFNLHYAARADNKKSERLTAKQMRSAAERLEKLDSWMIDFLHRRTRHPAAALRQLLGRDQEIGAARAKLIGLATDVYPSATADPTTKIRRAAARIKSRRPQAVSEPAPHSERPAPAARPSWFPASGRGPILGIDPRRLGELIDTGRLCPDFGLRGPSR